jgi:hypothetical protein
MSVDASQDFSNDLNDDGGVSNDTPPLTVPPDPMGGTGAIDPTAAPSLVNGLSPSLSSGLESTIGSFTSLAATNLLGNLVYRANAGSNPTQGATTPVPVAPGPSPAFSPVLLIAGAAIVLFLILKD